MGEQVTTWIRRLSAGDPRAEQAIWQHYYEKLIRLARHKLADLPRREADEEDMVASAFDSFFQGVQNQRFPKLQDRDDLWKLLVTITARKVFAQQKRMAAQKRGAGRVRGESVFGTSARGIEQFLAEEPTPETAAILAETVSELLGQLEDEVLRTIASMKMEAYTNEEIADQLNCVPRTVERKLGRIRRIWSRNTSWGNDAADAE